MSNKYDIETLIYTAMGALTAASSSYMAFKSVSGWETLSDISGLHWLEIFFAAFLCGLVALKAKLSDPPKQKTIKAAPREGSEVKMQRIGNGLYKKVEVEK